GFQRHIVHAAVLLHVPGHVAGTDRALVHAQLGVAGDFVKSDVALLQRQFHVRFAVADADVAALAGHFHHGITRHEDVHIRLHRVIARAVGVGIEQYLGTVHRDLRLAAVIELVGVFLVLGIQLLVHYHANRV